MYCCRMIGACDCDIEFHLNKQANTEPLPSVTDMCDCDIEFHLNKQANTEPLPNKRVTQCAPPPQSFGANTPCCSHTVCMSGKAKQPGCGQRERVGGFVVLNCL